MALQFRCADVGVACKATTTADSADELVAKVAEHARSVHGVELTQTLVDYALTKVTDTGRKG
jgi:predicted small metal-binding protein